MGKKGYDTVVRPDGDWLSRVSALNASWFYSWGDHTPAGLPAGIEFVPMIWGYYGDKSRDDARRLFPPPATPKIPGPSDPTLLGFNEPDGKDQANLPVDKALDAWPVLMETGRRLGSPAAVHADGPWMQQFMSEAKRRKLRVDFITVHAYMGPSTSGLLSYLNLIHNMYGLPIWLTEFAVADWSAKTRETNRHSPQRVQQFMVEVLPALEHAAYVERYSWFSFSAKSAAGGPSALFDEAGKLTDLGKIYAQFRS